MCVRYSSVSVSIMYAPGVPFCRFYKGPHSCRNNVRPNLYNSLVMMVLLWFSSSSSSSTLSSDSCGSVETAGSAGFVETAGSAGSVETAGWLTLTLTESASGIPCVLVCISSGYIHSLLHYVYTMHALHVLLTFSLYIYMVV